MRGTVPTDENGVDVMMEKWDAGSSEPPHSHPGDDMTVVVEGKMSVQFFKKEGDKLVEDGEPLILNKAMPGTSTAGEYTMRNIWKIVSWCTFTIRNLGLMPRLLLNSMRVVIAIVYNIWMLILLLSYY